MPDWLFYAIVILWVVWGLFEGLATYCITVANSRSFLREYGRSGVFIVTCMLWWVFTIFLWSYILLGLGAISLVSSLFE